MGLVDDLVSGTIEAPLQLRTLIVEAHTNGNPLAWLDGAVWPPVGAIIEIPTPHPRDAIVRAVRLQIDPPSISRYATVLIDAQVLSDVVEPRVEDFPELGPRPI